MDDTADLWSAHLGPVYGVEGVADLTGLTREEVRQRSGSEFFALTTTSGQVVYPAYQFAPDHSVVPVVREALRTVPMPDVNPWLLASWFVSPNEDLADTEPIKVAEHAGGPEVLAALARWIDGLGVLDQEMSVIEGVSAEQMVSLRRAGVRLRPPVKGGGLAAARTRLWLERMHEQGLTASQVADLLGVDAAVLTQMTAEKRLYAFGAATDPRYPPWQFRRGEVVTGLGAVIPLIPDGWPPVGVERFLTEPTPSLDGASPLDWLEAGHSVESVAALADRLRMRGW